MKNHANRRRRLLAGFSLLELLVTVSVAGTLASIAVPSFGRLVQDTRRATVVNELSATLLQARSQANASSRSIAVCGLEDSNGDGRLDPGERRCRGADWSRGWFAAPWTDTNRDGRVDPAELSEPLRVFINDAPGVAVRASGFANAAQPSGTVVLRPLDRYSSNGTLVVCDRRGAESARALVLAGNGRARLASRASDGRALPCP